MKKVIACFFVCITFLLFFSAKITIGSVTVCLEYNGNIILNKAYPVDAKTAVTVLFRYGNDYKRFYAENAKQAAIQNFSVINNDLSEDVDLALSIVEFPYRDAEVLWKNSKFSYKNGKNGLGANRQKLAEDFYGNYGKTVTLSLQTLEIPFLVTVDDRKTVTAERGSFSTSFADSAENRKANIALAASKLDGVVIEPNSIFSFNATVGRRTTENGFRKAKIISNGKFVDGVGGGVCQVSTTLYAAWLSAGLKAERVQNHSLPVSYVKPGFDAMVSAETDLQLRNDTDYRIYVSARVNSNLLTFTLYGEKTHSEVLLRSETLRILTETEYEEITAPLEWADNETQRIIKKPKNGLVCASYRDFKKNGVIYATEKLSVHYYKPQKGIVCRRQDVPEPESNEENASLSSASA